MRAVGSSGWPSSAAAWCCSAAYACWAAASGGPSIGRRSGCSARSSSRPLSWPLSPSIGPAAAKNSRATDRWRSASGIVGSCACTAWAAAVYRCIISTSVVPVPATNDGSSRLASASTASTAGRIRGGCRRSSATIEFISPCSAGVRTRAAIRSGTPVNVTRHRTFASSRPACRNARSGGSTWRAYWSGVISSPLGRSSDRMRPSGTCRCSA